MTISRFLRGGPEHTKFQKIIIILNNLRGVMNTCLNVGTITWIIKSQDAGGYNTLIAFCYIIVSTIGILYSKQVVKDERWIMQFRSIIFNATIAVLTLIF